MSVIFTEENNHSVVFISVEGKNARNFLVGDEVFRIDSDGVTTLGECVRRLSKMGGLDSPVNLYFDEAAKFGYGNILEFDFPDFFIYFIFEALGRQKLKSVSVVVKNEKIHGRESVKMLLEDEKTISIRDLSLKEFLMSFPPTVVGSFDWAKNVASENSNNTPPLFSPSNTPSRVLMGMKSVSSPTSRARPKSYFVSWESIGLSAEFDLSCLDKEQISLVEYLKAKGEHPVGTSLVPIPLKAFWIEKTEFVENFFVSVDAGNRGIFFTLKNSEEIFMKLDLANCKQEIFEIFGEPEEIDFFENQREDWNFYKLGLRFRFSRNFLETISMFNGLPDHVESFGKFDRCTWKFLPFKEGCLSTLSYKSSMKEVKKFLGSCDPPLILLHANSSKLFSKFPSRRLYKFPGFGFDFECTSAENPENDFISVFHLNSIYQE